MSTIVMAQLTATQDINKNLLKAKAYIIEAKEKYDAQMIVFPEGFMYQCMEKTKTSEPSGIIEKAQSLDGNFVTQMKRYAMDYNVWIVCGIYEKDKNVNFFKEFDKKVKKLTNERVYNTIIVINKDGELVSSYRKTHLYDAFGTKESDIFKPGDKLFEPIETPFGKMGLFVCYELRFPEIARNQAVKGAEFIVVPAAWYRGEHKLLHWEILLKSRALENTVFIVGCDHYSKEIFMGESRFIDPMGIVLSESGEGECLIPCYLDKEKVKETRKILPCYINRREELY